MGDAYAKDDPINVVDPDGTWGIPVFRLPRYHSYNPRLPGRHNPFRSWGTAGWFALGTGAMALAGGFVALGVAVHVAAGAGGPFAELFVTVAVHTPWIAAGAMIGVAGYSFKRALE